MNVRREKRIAATSDIGPYGCVASSAVGTGDRRVCAAFLIMCHCEASANTGCGNPFSSTFVQGYYGFPRPVCGLVSE